MKPFFRFLLLLTLAVPAFATDEAARLRGVLAELLPNLTPDSIVPAPVPGFYEVLYGPQVFYVSADGKFLLSGELIELKSQTNLTERRRGEARLTALQALGEESMIVYPAKGQVKHTITVFTDIDCGYCRKLHQGMKEMNDLGISVRYIAYPRAGVGSPSYRKAVSVWCAKDRHAALTAAKSGSEPKPIDCDAPVQHHMALGERFGVQGTPALVLDDGRMLPGYLPPQRLLKVLEE